MMSPLGKIGRMSLWMSGTQVEERYWRGEPGIRPLPFGAWWRREQEGIWEPL